MPLKQAYWWVKQSRRSFSPSQTATSLSVAFISMEVEIILHMK